MVGPTPEDFFQSALDCEARAETLPEAIENYQRVVDLAPNWIEAHINLGVAYYQMGQLTDARNAFLAAVQIDPLNGSRATTWAARLKNSASSTKPWTICAAPPAPCPPTRTFISTSALAYEKRGERRAAHEQWTLYLRYAPNGPWADQARERLQQSSGKRKRNPPIPFRRPS